MKIKKEDLSKRTSIRIGPVVDWIEAKSIDDLIEIDRNKELPKQFWIGNGSNLLASEKAKELLFISLSGEFNSIKYDGNTLDVGAAVKVPSLLNFCIKNGLSGLEWMAGVPATIGGAVFMNAGVGKNYIFSHIKSVDCLENGKIVTVKTFDFGYRKGLNKKILSVKFEVSETKKGKVLNNVKMAQAMRIKREPSGKSFGSVFKNPPGFYAGRLIEECGLKGETSGDAIISEKHANFIINRANASFEDVYGLILKAQEAVHKKFGIVLEKEVKIV